LSIEHKEIFMNRNFLKCAAILAAALTVAGCATTRPKPAVQDSNAQLASMQTQLQAKDQEIQDLHSQLESQQQSLSNNFSPSAPRDKYNLLKVPGVSGMDVQRALLRAGYDPGPLDGRPGKKTRAAVKAFQKKNNLTADGVVGERTWTALRSA
jgi:murein L,D-transpeptidase YcbB/YkuD